ncbi:Mitochondrial substrate carrier family protein ucpB [Acropora cervicornis]|uniref:Mitochondrial substrate carrier family protein ucpB n=1 Tax=Acropora cervicornis TaxID=6130 RepID=A0AAD9QIN2_ACRCE|nr:mitochondrial substrate carrier family protein ucpB-like [Acropora millepora]KAK2562046.1 Mitochondrial substrate carrier family protein ucpB [Acropora cervicornis]
MEAGAMYDKIAQRHLSKGKENAIRFALSGLSCMCAATVTNPIDVIKTRMQLENELGCHHESRNIFHNRYYRGLFRGALRITREEGLPGLYKGIMPSLMREATYSTLRLGLYEPLKEQFGARDPAFTPFWKKICAGAIAGAIGSAIACPTDVVKIRLMSPSGNQWGYKHTFHAFQAIISTEGIRGLWTGVSATVKRSALVSATAVSSYDHLKHAILNARLMKEGPFLHIVASSLAGFVTNCVTSPIDMVRTRYMNQKKDGKNPVLYKGTLDCIVKTVRKEGLFGLYKGFIPNWTRTGTHTVVTFFVFEQLRAFVGLRPI